MDAAIKLIDSTGRAATMSASDLSLMAAENYYDKKASYRPLLPDEATNPVWVFDKGLGNVQPLPIPTPIWNSVMALRLAEATLRQDAQNSQAIPLWLAASMSRELQLPAGATDPTRGSGPDAAFYFRAAGPIYVNPVLARALDAHDSALALKAIEALEATGGANGLTGGGENAPLVRSLSYPDRAVRFGAAFALAAANPDSQFPSFYRVVPILDEAVSSTGSPIALVVSLDPDARNKLADALRSGSSHYVVYAGGTLSAAIEQARSAPAFDVVIVPGGPDMTRVVDIGHSDYRLSGVPVLVTTEAADLPTLKAQLGGMKGFEALDIKADEAALTSALTAARTDVGNVPLDAAKATQYATRAISLLGVLAADHHSIYQVSEAVPTLAGALTDKRPEIASAAAVVLGRINSADGGRRWPLSPWPRTPIRSCGPPTSTS